ncbi:ATP-dependent DNA helicase RecG [Micavibrio aeruginosavorus]|uniref:ATP-dependent DNA helicase RecG n=1 Tax=Micavibrio aeruginosavorus TaxID=349221 RepID=UPI003F4AC69A
MTENAQPAKHAEDTSPPKTIGRPFALDPLFRPLTALSGIGPRNGKLLEKLVGGPKILDLLWHKPIDFIDRRYAPTLAEALPGKTATLTLRVEKHTPNTRRNLPYRVRCADDTGAIDLVFFNAHKDYIEKNMPLGATIIASGKVEAYQGQLQMVHPDALGALEDKDSIATIEPIYALTAGVTNKAVRKAITSALPAVPPLPEWQDAAYFARQHWPAWDDALRTLHNPPGENGLSPLHPARARLAYDELLANQLALSLVRYRQRKVNGRAYNINGPHRARVLAAVPFELTGAQKQSLVEIDADMGSDERMLRLLQGDVGSGKTVVAALSMMNAIDTGAQAALMAPTEILARQHAQSLKPWLDAAGVRFVILTGRDKGKARDLLLQQIASGAAQVVIGTHALFQDDVIFSDLGLAVIDEQHRFGVHQRLQLASKGRGVDTLVMTATPIPRTLTLTAYGDMDVSRLNEKPPGRKPVDTRLMSQDKLDEMIDGVARQIAAGARVYWVCPLVEESEVMDLAAAEERFDILQARFGDRVGLVHGRLKPQEKDEVMEKFARGDLSILVATTVIEVGVNVPEATIMIIEHAERFGLAQLHQLRGRVGRGGDKSFCFLLYAGPLSDNGKARLATMRDTEDGFLIAEKDLELRGSGDILGTKQSGLPTFRLADLSAHAELLATARDDARLIIDKDPDLKGPRGNALRHLLYLFERDQAIQYLRSG